MESPVAPAVLGLTREAGKPVYGLVSTAGDLARLAAALLNAGVVKGERLIPATVVSGLFRAQAALPGGEGTTALGMRVGRWSGHNIVTVAGGGQGHGVLLQLLPDARLGVIILTNGSGVTLREAATLMLERILAVEQRQAAPAAAAADPLVLEEMAAAPGRYLNGSELMEIVVQDGRPLMRSGDLLLELKALPGGMVGALVQGRVALTFRFLHDAEGRPYLWTQERALVRNASPPPRR